MTKIKSARNNGSNSINPNNKAYKAARDNRANQLNKNNPVYSSFRSKSKEEEEE